jgi:hypothetical protein
MLAALQRSAMILCLGGSRRVGRLALCHLSGWNIAY